MANLPKNNIDGLPSFIRNWQQMYGIVLITLLLEIIIFYALTIYFR